MQRKSSFLVTDAAHMEKSQTDEYSSRASSAAAYVSRTAAAGGTASGLVLKWTLLLNEADGVARCETSRISRAWMSRA
jgi:hypothetical protein